MLNNNNQNNTDDDDTSFAIAVILILLGVGVILGVMFTTAWLKPVIYPGYVDIWCQSHEAGRAVVVDGEYYCKDGNRFLEIRLEETGDDDGN